MIEFALLASMTIQVCTPQARHDLPQSCQERVRPQFYQTWELCDKARTQGIEGGVWLNAAKIFNVPAGWVIRIDCTPGRDIIVPEAVQ